VLSLCSVLTLLGHTIAIKYLHQTGCTNGQFEEFLREAEIMAQCINPYVVLLLGICVDGDCKALVQGILRDSRHMT
jgi:hypothetical protein